ncbi:hypothetical protein [Flavobacterium sp. CS20]|uniref:hypothetical protein n=1 Tax=Flavobacterium sp. CS20 TaxID=2775246 RepID=UPI001B3A5407|nr:hypothetical protein [Flavobacterium sp. CS20]QTY26437.1 hypothetical protein IGB25_10930 [Flavobacterium sp. CS20]
MIKQVIIIALSIITLIGCKNETKKVEVAETIDKNKVEVKTETTQEDYQVGSQVPNKLVCMVNNAYMGKPQIAVPVNGKTYYGCCQMCVGTLNEKESARTGIDPFSNKPVDKTDTYIVLMKKEGEVAYFESKENYLKYKKSN